MENQDTISLLKECDSGTKMAVTSIDEVLGKVQDSDMKSLLTESKMHHEKLGNEIHSLLIEHGSEEKDPSAMAKSMSWLKTNMKVGMEKVTRLSPMSLRTAVTWVSNLFTNT